MYKIGEKTWFNGNEITITSEPYELYGGTWQDGTDKNGKTFTVRTPGHASENVAEKQNEWKNMQEGFRRLRQEENE